MYLREDLGNCLGVVGSRKKARRKAERNYPNPGCVWGNRGFRVLGFRGFKVPLKGSTRVPLRGAIRVL